MFFGRIMAFGPHGRHEDGTWCYRLVSVSADPAHGRNVEPNCPPTLEKESWVMPGWGGLWWLVKNIGGL